MALYRWFRPVNGVLDPKGPLSSTVPPSVLTEVNKEVKKAQEHTKKRGSYVFFTPEEKARVAKYGSENGVMAALRRFSRELGRDLKENTVRDWIKVYRKEIQKQQSSTKIGDDRSFVVAELTGKKRGRPVMLGEKIDAEIRTIIRAMRDSGAVVNTSIAIATAVGVLRKRDKSLLKENGGPLEPGLNPFFIQWDLLSGEEIRR